MLFRGDSATNNNSHKHKKNNNKNQHKLKTKDHPKLQIVGWYILFWVNKRRRWIKTNDDNDTLLLWLCFSTIPISLHWNGISNKNEWWRFNVKKTYPKNCIKNEIGRHKGSQSTWF